MDPAKEPLSGEADLAAIVAQQSQHLSLQALQLDQLTALLQQHLADQQRPPSPPVAAPPSAVSPATLGPRLRLPLPSKFEGDPKLCRGFIAQCSLHIELMADQFPTERSRVAFVVSLLSGKALDWATPLWDRSDPVTADLRTFLTEFRSVFEEPARASSAETALLNLRQGDSTVGDYSILFRTLASELSWNDAALCATFKKGLSSRVKDVLAARDIPSSLNELICLATRIDVRFIERQEELRHERQHLGHVGEASLGANPSSPRLTIPAEVITDTGLVFQVPAFLDSGSAGNFIHAALAARYRLPLDRLEKPLAISSVSGELLSDAIRFKTKPVSLRVGVLHKERISFLVLPRSSSDILLGLPWLQRHAPTLNWRTGEIERWGSNCQKFCLVAPRPAHAIVSSAPIRSLPGLPAEYQEFSDVFSEKQAESLPPHRPYDCPIDLQPGTSPPRGRVYPLSVPETQAMSAYIQENLQKGFIQKSSSPAGAGFFFVQKKDGSLRPCIDYRGLNKITIKNRYPLPLISELFDRLQGAKVFTKLDLRGAYNLIRIRRGDEWKTAFNTRDGHFEYLVMPFGLCNAPAVFQEFVNDVFRDLLYSCVIVYLDDILVYSPDLPTHRLQVRQVLQRLRNNRLYAKPEKCLFHQSCLPFLGYIVSGKGLRMDPTKLSAILQWPRPVGLRAIQRFLGFANYYRQFIPHFSTLVAPIVALTKKKANPRDWPPAAEKAFSELKVAFASAPILSRPDPEKPFALEVDASSVGAGAVLTQKGHRGRTLSCGFFSRTFSPAERNYAIGDRELLAIKMALEEWRHLLEGARHPFDVYTDHKNLLYLQTAQRLNSRQARWSLFFSRFDFRIHFRPAEKNVRADALSRASDIVGEESQPQHIIAPERLVHAAPASLQQVPPGKTYVRPSLRRRILKWGHSSLLAGHPGAQRSYQLISRFYWWPGLAKDTKEFVEACTTCARNKTPRRCPAGLLLPLPTPSTPWTHVAMDFITDLPPSSGNTVIWVVTDRFSKMSLFVPVPGLPSAPRLAALFFKHVFRLHGLPQHIVSDRGVQFVSKFWRALCSRLQVKLDFSSAYHPQSNGQVERVNQVLGVYLRHFVSARQDDWSDLLPWAEFSYNSLDSESSGASPFYVVYGRHPRPPLPLALASEVPAVDAMVGDMTAIWEQTRKSLQRAAVRMKAQADKRRRPAQTFAPGDKVWLSAKFVRLKIPSYKLGPRFLGPFEVLSRINPVAYKLRLPPSMRIPNSFHVSLLKPVVLNRFSQRIIPPSPEAVAPDVFAVKDILAMKHIRGRRHFLVDWEGFGPEERSWEPEENILDRALLVRFLRRRGRPKGGGTVTGGPAAPQPGRGLTGTSARSPAAGARGAAVRVSDRGRTRPSVQPNSPGLVPAPLRLLRRPAARPRSLGRARAGSRKFKGTVSQ